MKIYVRLIQWSNTINKGRLREDCSLRRRQKSARKPSVVAMCQVRHRREPRHHVCVRICCVSWSFIFINKSLMHDFTVSCRHLDGCPSHGVASRNRCGARERRLRLLSALALRPLCSRILQRAPACKRAQCAGTQPFTTRQHPHFSLSHARLTVCLCRFASARAQCRMLTPRWPRMTAR